MSLRRALDVLPDDRATASAARDLLVFLESHPGQALTLDRITRATSIPAERVERLMRVFVDSFVVDCAGSAEAWEYSPTSLLGLEVKRYLRSSSSDGAKLQLGAERFRSRFGPMR